MTPGRTTSPRAKNFTAWSLAKPSSPCSAAKASPRKKRSPVTPPKKLDYAKRGQTIQAEAEKDDRAAGAAERRALRYDLGEGMLEIALVLSSLYFISRRKMFPVIGVVAGLAGMAVAVTGMLS